MVIGGATPVVGELFVLARLVVITLPVVNLDVVDRPLVTGEFVEIPTPVVTGALLLS